ncbi:carbohydrate-binding module family 20 domain-containing protein [Kitasatospora phosalacinea]|uniref:carbohydrate-binding module family 20 domain-containing protein n=1 Tax=Kitasatospora phosalacinea TaxID=2065 RepID=UPI0007C78CF7|nr:carbohydrate-binding module family 20 domain-containing protein [Kitasatospora phosalacinea]
MTNPSSRTRVPRPIALAAAGAAVLLAPLAAAPSASAAEGTAPPTCVQYYSSWRYTEVANDCSAAVGISVRYTDGQVSPCRTVPPGARATFAGYGTDMNYVTGLLTCSPAPVTAVFRATATTAYGQGLYLAGNLAELGGWDPAKAVPLTTDSGSYPAWTADLQLPSDTPVEYKYLIKDPDGTVVWEDGDNRTALTPATGTFTADDTWR